MRHSPTHSEALLWSYLKASRLGVAFRRQVVLGEYIVDFLAPAVKLVVEIDGGYHTDRVRLDAVRETRLTRAGYRVVRVSHDLVVRDAPEAVRVIASWL
jgi:very-short-patch-repair endonuclease